MKIQSIAVAVTMINLLLMGLLLAKINPAAAQKEQEKLQMLRGSGLEIMDKQGRVRASISFHEPVVQNGVTYPAGVLLRLINSKGQPSVKIDAAEDGAGLSFSNESQGYIQLIAKQSGGFLKIKDADGKEKLVKP